MAAETPTDHDHAIAVAAVSWLAADGEQISRFMALTGVDPEHIRAAAKEPGFLAGVLEFLMGHEPTLMRFCDENDISPETVQRAHIRLSGQPVPGPGDFV
ncbi:MAG: DUF3572 domain-containing protein [Pseudomonadota bacterium]